MSDEEGQVELSPQEQVVPVEQAPVAVESAPVSNPFEDLAKKLEEFEQRLASLESAPPPVPLSDGLIAHIATLAYQQMEEQLRAQLGLSTKQPARG